MNNLDKVSISVRGLISYISLLAVSATTFVLLVLVYAFTIQKLKRNRRKRIQIEDKVHDEVDQIDYDVQPLGSKEIAESHLSTRSSTLSTAELNPWSFGKVMSKFPKRDSVEDTASVVTIADGLTDDARNGPAIEEENVEINCITEEIDYGTGNNARDTSEADNLDQGTPIESPVFFETKI